MATGLSDSRFVRAVNAVVLLLMEAPLLGGVVRRGMVEIRYVGRRSGRTFQTPVAYRRDGDTIVIGVSMADRKTWWRNFLGEGAPITFVGLDGRDRTGHAVAAQDGRGGASVTARLNQP